MKTCAHTHEQSMNHVSLKMIGIDGCEVTHCAECVSANTRPHHLHAQDTHTLAVQQSEQFSYLSSYKTQRDTRQKGLYSHN